MLSLSRVVAQSKNSTSDAIIREPPIVYIYHYFYHQATTDEEKAIYYCSMLLCTVPKPIMITPFSPKLSSRENSMQSSTMLHGAL